MKPINKPWPDFKGSDDCKPGVLIRVRYPEGGETDFLIGHLNRNGGFCNCCDLDDRTVVLTAIDCWPAIEAAGLKR